MRRYRDEWKRMNSSEQFAVAAMAVFIAGVFVTVGLSGDASRGTIALEESFFAVVLVAMCGLVACGVRILAMLRQEIARERDESWSWPED